MKNNWQTKKLSEICDIYQPKTISAKEMVSDGRYLVYGANGVIGRYDKFNHEEPQLLITCRGATCGSVNISTPRSWITGNAMVIKPSNKSLEIRFLEYLFRGGIDISKVITGAAQPQITRTNLAPLEISFPESLLEQKRIVKILDEVFEKIQKVKENTEKNLQNSRELFETYLQNIFTIKSNLWESKRLGEIAIFRNGMNFTKGSKGDVIKIVGVKDFQKSFWIPLENLESVTIDGKLTEIDLLEKGDILTVRSNGNPKLIGRVLIAGDVTENISHSGFTIRIRLNSKVIDPLYLCHFLKTKRTKKELIESGTGINIKSLNQTTLSTLLILFPKSLSEQKEIITKLDELSEQTKRLEEIYKQKLADLEELKKSVLNKAFAGEL